ncbi:MAG: FAD-dependent oxidoreductase [Lachnospiraceae bacterium]|jgi:formate dehydrogenase major subunit
MEQIRITINEIECIGNKGDTILDIAVKHGIFIPTLCYYAGVKQYGACGVCLCEGEGLPKLMRACSTVAADGWVVSTRTPRVVQARKVALELLMSDHDGDCQGPCRLNCPAGTDPQAYIKHIAEGNYREAVKSIKETNPLPASIGRVCPHPCEETCRRQYVEEAISISYLKYFAADKNLALGFGKSYAPEVKPLTGKKVAVIGGGPAGLTAAFFLRLNGHSVTVFEQMDEMGGMLRYGVPEYRLPKRILQREIAEIANLGIELKNGMKLGRDFTLEELRSTYDAVLVAIGAWKSKGVGCPGDDAQGVVGGIDFLYRVGLAVDVYGMGGKLTEDISIGRNVAVVGGGNTAMDACRTCVRLGAENVYVIYRRTRAEMPADDIEIEEAIEEGIQFKFLTNPAEIISEGGKVRQLKLQVMELGEPDASGRRSPVPIEGQFEILDVDCVIAAIGQNSDNTGLEALDVNKRGFICADESTFRTSLEDVFAVGDATNMGPHIAISAIGEAHKAAEVIHSYLSGDMVPYTAPFVSERDLDTVKTELADKEKVPRIVMPKMEPSIRKTNFLEVNLGFSEDDVLTEARRCLECGCHDYEECRLITCANCDAICPERFAGEQHLGFTEEKLVVIERNQNKCILCNLCVRTCDENAGKGILGLVGRGFTTVIKPEFNDPATIADCKDCLRCAEACPTGALRIIS